MQEPCWKRPENATPTNAAGVSKRRSSISATTRRCGTWKVERRICRKCGRNTATPPTPCASSADAQWSRGLFLDRRAFLQSYDPEQDDDQSTILTRILQAVVPVCAGINLEYYFSYVDPTGYGCGTKLPHNITSLLGVMNGAASDLRPGLPWQMVEIHDPVRLLFVIETTPEAMLRIMDRNEAIGKLVRGGWVQLATLDPAISRDSPVSQGKVRALHAGNRHELPEVESSLDWYRGWRDHLGFASVRQLAHRNESDHERRRTSFNILGLIVVASPAALVAVLGLPPLVGRPLSEQTIESLHVRIHGHRAAGGDRHPRHDAGPGHASTCRSNWATGSSFLNSIFTFI